MKHSTKIPFSNKPLRSIYDPAINGYWFSVVDLFAIITNSNHKTARNYWKRFKNKVTNENDQLVTESNQLKWQSPDGKFYFTEAVNFKNLLYLIQTCPSPKANPYRTWLIDIFLTGISANELEKQLAELGKESVKIITEKYKNNPNEPYVRKTTTRRDIPLQ